MKKLIEVIYFGSAAIGAILVAANIGLGALGYMLFLISSVLGGWLAYHSDASRSILWVNVMFGCINVLGIVRYL